MPAAAPPNQSPFSLAFVAHAVHRRGGMERAACEVLARVARRVPVTVIASACDMPEASLRFERVTAPQRPAVLRTWAFARAARTIETRVGATITNAIGAAAIDADVITAQFCHAAFTARFGGLRGGRGLRALYQRVSGARFVAEERHAYGSRRLKQVIAVSQGTAREVQEFYGVAEERITVVPNGVDRTVFAPAADGEAKAALRTKLGLPADAFLALFVGGDWERKGVRDAIAAIATLVPTRSPKRCCACGTMPPCGRACRSPRRRAPRATTGTALPMSSSPSSPARLRKRDRRLAR
ncbi:hypothetical protein EBR44_09040 [bacterium]|nr:hypothetical protein [bacterium]